MNTQEQETGTALLQEAHAAWLAMAQTREKRKRNKNFTYGNQWCDLIRDDSGNTKTEYDYLRESGKEPLSNNLIRQLVKSVVGRFRNSLGAPDERLKDIHAVNQTDELDSRMMEEFLISGCCFQKISLSGQEGKPVVRIDNLNPDRMILNAVSDPRGWDCRLIGELHDMSLPDIVGLLADGNRSKALRICEIYNSASPASEKRETGILRQPENSISFWESTTPGKLRIVELWAKESRECYECHDRQSGEWFCTGISSAKQI